jgi:hypothetical protein
MKRIIVHFRLTTNLGKKDTQRSYDYSNEAELESRIMEDVKLWGREGYKAEEFKREPIPNVG